MLCALDNCDILGMAICSRELCPFGYYSSFFSFIYVVIIDDVCI